MSRARVPLTVDARAHLVVGVGAEVQCVRRFRARREVDHVFLVSVLWARLAVEPQRVPVVDERGEPVGCGPNVRLLLPAAQAAGRLVRGELAHALQTKHKKACKCEIAKNGSVKRIPSSFCCRATNLLYTILCKVDK